MSFWSTGTLCPFFQGQRNRFLQLKNFWHFCTCTHRNVIYPRVSFSKLYLYVRDTKKKNTCKYRAYFTTKSFMSRITTSNRKDVSVLSLTRFCFFIIHGIRDEGRKEMVLLKVKLAAMVRVNLVFCGLGFTSSLCFIFLSNQFVYISFEVEHMYFRCSYNWAQWIMLYHLVPWIAVVKGPLL